MKKWIKAIPLPLHLPLAVVVIICLSMAIVAAFFLVTMNDTSTSAKEVELRIKWVISEGKYSPINVSVGDILYGKRGMVEIKIEAVKGEGGEKQMPYTIIKDAKGIVLKGGDKVEEGMKLHLVEKPEELITIPEASIPSIEVVKIVN